MKTVLIVGGNRNKSFEKKGQEKKFKIIHHPAHVKQKKSKKYFESMIKQSDCIVLFTDACSHQNMWDIRDLSKSYQKPIVYPKGTGTSQALQLASNALEEKQIS
ncbi:DUF2325 domain-containing protein [Schinkia azotoformans]|uniref:DUF2325 domain-containing protein n=1 Tax=Schinkia azotoformans TaxID=1454 RepID=UPI002DBB63FA|nr:DUF2325 domain-containing protein [Schinkia azotoformans]MEC1718456.1 DUF2325 domain-containing protein [Schinkia azotoformans]MEC1759830.1 DUF2325 domain-containing protein [Schinkia azotoformans]